MNRNSKFDNIKAFLIFTVVLGHVLEFLYGTEGVYGIVRAIIYSFHMPAFVFLSGYFSKYSKKPLSYITVYYLCTYLIFNVMFSLTPWRVAPPFSFLYPQLIYWYLLCLWFWRMITPALAKIRFIIPISILFALYIGCFEEADRFLATSRVICFLPFFLAGYYFKIEMIKRINKAAASIILFFSFLITAIMNNYRIIPVKMYEYIQCYNLTGVNNVNGMIMRLCMIIISFLVIISLISLAPSRHLWLTSFGRNSLMIYLVHIFFIKLISHLNFAGFDNLILNIVFSLALSFLLCFILSRQILNNAYSSFISKLAKASTFSS